MSRRRDSSWGPIRSSSSRASRSHIRSSRRSTRFSRGRRRALGGKPAFKLVVRGVDLIKGAKLPDDPEMRAERLERMKQREEQRSVYFVVAHGARIFYLLIEFPGPIDDAFLKRVTDSFQYL